jgi:hypothetical protein
MPRVRPCGPLCGLVGAREGKDSAPRDFKRFWADFRCAEIGAGESLWRFIAPLALTAARSADCHGGLRHFEIDADHAETNMLWRYFL